MRTFLLVSLAFVIALVVGFGGTISALTDGRQVAAKQYGQWYGWPDAGSSEIDPYLRADLARSGKLQLGRAEGVTFYAETDEQGEQLSGSCTYVIAGKIPKASAWTMRSSTVTSSQFSVLPGATKSSYSQFFVVNNELQFAGTDEFKITLSTTPQAGNWLKVPSADFKLTLNVYDTNTFVVVGHDKIELPRIVRGACS